MQYMLMIYVDPANPAPGSVTAEQQEAVTAEYMAIREQPGVQGGGRLAGAETATTVRVQDGSVLTTDGPFAETKEELGGYFLLDAPDLDEAIALAARIPAARFGGAIEVRPVAMAG